MKSSERSELGNYILAGSFGSKGCVVKGQRAGLMSGANISYPARFECLGNMSASQMAEHA